MNIALFKKGSKEPIGTKEVADSVEFSITGLKSGQAVSEGDYLIKLVDTDETKPVPAFTVVETKKVTGVDLNQKTMTLKVGDTKQLTETITPADAENKKVTWTSNDETTATVANGLVTAVKEGKAKITATSDDGKFTAVCDVTVNPAGE